MTVNNGQVPSTAQAQSKHVLAITFTPKEAKPHIIDIKFNGEAVEGKTTSGLFWCSSRMTDFG